MYIIYWTEGTDVLWIYFFFNQEDFKKHSIVCIESDEKCGGCCPLLESLTTPIEKCYFHHLSKNEDAIRIFDSRVACQASVWDSTQRIDSKVIYRGDIKPDEPDESYGKEKLFAMLITAIQKITSKADESQFKIEWAKSVICLKFQVALSIPLRLFHIYKSCQAHVLLANLDDNPKLLEKHKRTGTCFELFEQMRSLIDGKYNNKFIKI